MAENSRLIGVIFMALILVFACIHFGLAVGILAKYASYGSVFRPERGLAAFNLVISVLALLIGGFGLFSILTDRGMLSRVVGFVGFLLALFTLASLITALIINSLSINYVGSRFSDQMGDYKASQDARNIVDKIQTKYTCCGENTWVDWSRVSLNATLPSTNNTGTTTTAAPTNATTTAAAMNTTAITAAPTTKTAVTTAAGTTTAAAAGVTTTATEGVTTIAAETTTPINSNARFNRVPVVGVLSSVAPRTTSPLPMARVGRDLQALARHSDGVRAEDENSDGRASPFQRNIRRKRQTQSGYGGFYGLPSSYIVTLPQSCCTDDLSATTDLRNLYCLSSVNNVTGNFHTDGCLKKLGKVSGGLSLGIAVINCFLLILSLAAIPVLFELDQPASSAQHQVTHQYTAYPQPQVYGYPDYNPAAYDAAMYNPAGYNNNQQAFYPGY